MKRIHSYIFFLVVLPILSVISYGQTPLAKSYHSTLDFIEKMGRDVYCYWDIKKEQYQVNWDKIIQTAHSKINDSTNSNQFQKILTELTASVKDGHVNYIYESKKPIFYLPLKIKNIENEYYISQIEKDRFEPHGTELDVGDRILEVNGQKITDFIAQRSNYISGSTAAHIRSKATRSLNSWPYYEGIPSSNMTLVIKKFSSQQLMTVELPWLIYNKEDIYYKAANVVSAKILPGNIGLLSISAMKAESDAVLIDFINNQMDSLQNTNAIIIDVRDNGGGSGNIGDAIISRFIDSDTIRYKAQIRNSSQLMYARPDLTELFKKVDPSQSEYSEWVDFPIKPNLTATKYSNPVFVLVNENCFSACDTFVDSFSSNHVGEVLGHQSGGGTGYPLWVELPRGLGNIRFSVMRGYSKHGRYLEGTGTIPDFAISPTSYDIANKTDGELLKSYLYVTSKINKTNNINMAKDDLRTYFVLQNKPIIPFSMEENHWQTLQKFY